ncbi:MAG: phosphoribosylglycinamide formyltransferase [Clostridia bacterium]|nr:phosphoribosylglycinamide formyltransferase [Clostridia bacterium]
MSINLVVFASGNGSTLQAIIDAINMNKLDAKIELVVSNNKNAYAIERAKKFGICTYIISSKKIDEIDDEMFEVLKKYNIDLIVLAGYLKMIGPKLLKKYRIINTHPSLLPKYGGKGMHGVNVHKAVIDAKEKISGVTLHFVNSEYDKGEIIRQTTVEVLKEDNAESLSAKVQIAEKKQLIEVLQEFSKNRI